VLLDPRHARIEQRACAGHSQPQGGVILIGHDWGAPTVYNSALIHHDRCVALATMSVAYYTQEFARSGFFGPISRYRNHTRDFNFLQPYKGRKINQPAFFIGGDRDMAFNMFNSTVNPLDTMRHFVTNLEGAHILRGCGHWTQQERPQEVNDLLVPWLRTLRGRVV
jgi:pimeloyl-ACP methyl ester carboxylesterase